MAEQQSTMTFTHVYNKPEIARRFSGNCQRIGGTNLLSWANYLAKNAVISPPTTPMQSGSTTNMSVE